VREKADRECQKQRSSGYEGFYIGQTTRETLVDPKLRGNKRAWTYRECVRATGYVSRNFKGRKPLKDRVRIHMETWKKFTRKGEKIKAIKNYRGIGKT